MNRTNTNIHKNNQLATNPRKMMFLEGNIHLRDGIFVAVVQGQATVVLSVKGVGFPIAPNLSQCALCWSVALVFLWFAGKVSANKPGTSCSVWRMFFCAADIPPERFVRLWMGGMEYNHNLWIGDSVCDVLHIQFLQDCDGFLSQWHSSRSYWKHAIEF